MCTISLERIWIKKGTCGSILRSIGEKKYTMDFINLTAVVTNGLGEREEVPFWINARAILHFGVDDDGTKVFLGYEPGDYQLVKETPAEILRKISGGKNDHPLVEVSFSNKGASGQGWTVDNLRIKVNYPDGTEKMYAPEGRFVLVPGDDFRITL